MWKEFVSNRLVILAVGGVVGFFIRSLWSHQLSKQLEDYKGELAKDFERFKGSLAAEVFERQTRYEWLHTERAKVLVELYRLLSKVDMGCSRVILVTYLNERSRITVDKAIDVLMEEKKKFTDEFVECIKENRVFLGSELTQKLAVLEKKYAVLFGVQASDEPPTGKSPVEDMERMKRDIAPLLHGIQEKIQEMLGVN